jgi:myosin-5
MFIWLSVSFLSFLYSQWESQSSCIYPASQHSTPRSSSTSPAALNSSSSSQPEQQHRTTTSSSSSRSPLGAIVEDPTHSPADAAAPEAAPDVQEWSNVLAVFDDLLLQLHNNWVPRQVVAAMFGQLFAFVNVQLFNQVMLRRECCSLANAEYVFAGLEQVSCSTCFV